MKRSTDYHLRIWQGNTSQELADQFTYFVQAWERALAIAKHSHARVEIFTWQGESHMVTAY